MTTPKIVEVEIQYQNKILFDTVCSVCNNRMYDINYRYCSLYYSPPPKNRQEKYIYIKQGRPPSLPCVVPIKSHTPITNILSVPALRILTLAAKSYDNLIYPRNKYITICQKIQTILIYNKIALSWRTNAILNT